MRYVLFALAVVAAVVAVGGGRQQAEAHALLVRAEPPVNAQLREPPAQLTLYFSEPLERRYSTVRVLDQHGNQVEESVEFDDADNALMRVTIPRLEPGFITVQWETVSTIDGHRVTGSYPLTILHEDGSLPEGEPLAPGTTIAGDAPHPLRVLTKWVLLVVGAVFTGALAFLAYVMPSSKDEAGVRASGVFQRRSVLIAAGAIVVLALAGVVELVLQAADIGAGIVATLETRWGERWLVRNLILLQPALILLALGTGLIRGRVPAVLALVGAAGYLVLTASVSHAAAGGGSFWAILTDFVHLAAASVWIGLLALVVLLFVWARHHLSPPERYPILSTALQRFSLLATVSVALLIFTGTVSAIVHVGQVADLLDTGYGRALLVKLLLMLPLLGIGAYNAYLLRPDFAEAAETQSQRNRQDLLAQLERQLSFRIRWELGVAVVLLAVVALLVQLTPTRGRMADPSQAPGEFIETREEGGIVATLVIEPNQPGINTFELFLAGAVDIVESARLEFVQPGGFAGDSALVMEESNPPTFYLGQGPYLTDSGNWIVILNLRTTVRDIRLTYNVNVADEPGTPLSEPRTGGSFASPIPISTSTVVLLLVSGAASVAIIAGSVPRPGLPEGYFGMLAAELAYRVGPVNIRPAWSLAVLIVAGIGLGLVIGAHVDPPLSSEEASRDNPVPATQESIDRGRMLFMQNCTVCHGETGRGDGPAAAALRIPPANLYDHIPYHPDQFFYSVISRGLSDVMPAFEGQIDEEDRWNIINFLRDQFGEGPALE